MGHRDTNKIALLARILIAKHGSIATAKAAERLLEWVRAGDVQTGAVAMLSQHRATTDGYCYINEVR